MKQIKVIITALFFSTLLFFSCNGTKSSRVLNKFEGVWKVVEIINGIEDSKQIILNPQPGIWIFSEGYYSSVWIPGSELRESYEKPFNPSNDEMIKAYNSIVVNTGTYEVTDSTLITFPIVSRVPDFSGGKGIYRFKFQSDTLYLTMIEEYSNQGDWATWLDSSSLTIKLLKTGKYWNNNDQDSIY